VSEGDGVAQARSGGDDDAPVTAGRPALVPVDEAVLHALVDVAVRDADADDVTPRLDGSAGWSEARVEWLRAYHRDRRPGLDGPLGEATWAVVRPDGPVGSVRLQCTADPGVLEVGLWLARRARARGWGRSAVRAVADVAAERGAVALRADTGARNAPALAVLARLGFVCEPADVDGRVAAVLVLRGPG
jgi:RimJ/RimL family protein N-acetyltransferase